jgi:hypothetical protein
MVSEKCFKRWSVPSSFFFMTPDTTILPDVRIVFFLLPASLHPKYLPPPGPPPGAPRWGPPRAFRFLVCIQMRGPMTGRPRGPPRGGPPGPASGPRPPIGGAPPRGDEGPLFCYS